MTTQVQTRTPLSPYERISLALIAMLEVGYVVFFLIMTDGLRLVAHTPGTMATLILALLAGFALAGAALWITLSGTGPAVLPDEREGGIDVRAERAAYWAMETQVFALVGATLAQAAGWIDMGSFAPATPHGLVFWLITIANVTAMVRMWYSFTASRRNLG